jgi:hypothetical protein
MKIEQINQCYLAYNLEHDMHIREYYMYCISLLRDRLANYSGSINVVLGPYAVVFPNQNKVVRIDLQVEHTLVKAGGRSVEEHIYGTVQYANQQVYLIRIPKFGYYNALDYVIEYSFPNMYNISTNSIFDQYLKKVIHIYPTLYEERYGTVQERDGIVCLFDSGNERRDFIVDKMRNLDININNVTNCFESKALQALYDRTKILVNIHQTDHHDTFEELRVLPALLRGALIVSEHVPLKEKIPYSEYIIWADYKDLPSKVLDVSRNYEEYYDTVFNNGNLKNIVKQMIESNNKNINLII